MKTLFIWTLFFIAHVVWTAQSETNQASQNLAYRLDLSDPQQDQFPDFPFKAVFSGAILHGSSKKETFEIAGAFLLKYAETCHEREARLEYLINYFYLYYLYGREGYWIYEADRIIPFVQFYDKMQLMCEDEGLDCRDMSWWFCHTLRKICTKGVSAKGKDENFKKFWRTQIDEYGRKTLAIYEKYHQKKSILKKRPADHQGSAHTSQKKVRFSSDPSDEQLTNEIKG